MELDQEQLPRQQLVNHHAPCSTNCLAYCWRGGEVKGAQEDVLNNALFPSKAGSGVSVFRVEVMLCQPLVSTPLRARHILWGVGLWNGDLNVSCGFQEIIIYYPPEVSSMKYCCLGIFRKEYLRLLTK